MVHGELNTGFEHELKNDLKNLTNDDIEKDEKISPMYGGGIADFIAVALLFMGTSVLTKFVEAFVSEAGKTLSKKLFSPDKDEKRISSIKKMSDELGLDDTMDKHRVIHIKVLLPQNIEKSELEEICYLINPTNENELRNEIIKSLEALNEKVKLLEREDKEEN